MKSAPHEIPVYLFMGFLESGKTTFARETLIERNFTGNEPTLLLVTEEGIEEYDKTALAKRNVSVVVMEEADINTEYLLDLQDEYNPVQVMIEYNGMWMLDKLFEIRVPKAWIIVQVLTFVNAGTYDLYHANMKAMMLEHLQAADMIIFNRCTEDTKKASIRMAIKSVNKRAQLIFESVDGKTEVDKGELELPYDIEADFIELSDNEYGIFYLDASEHPEKYEGKNIKFKGLVYKPKQYGKKAFVPGRFAMTCCADDIAFLGFKCNYNESEALKDRTWVTVTAQIKCEYYEDFQGDGPVFYATTVEKADEPEEELVYFE